MQKFCSTNNAIDGFVQDLNGCEPIWLVYMHKQNPRRLIGYFHTLLRFPQPRLILKELRADCRGLGHHPLLNSLTAFLLQLYHSHTSRIMGKPGTVITRQHVCDSVCPLSCSFSTLSNGEETSTKSKALSTRNAIMLQHLIIQFPLYFPSSGRLWEVNNKRTFQTFSSQRGSISQEVPNTVI